MMSNEKKSNTKLRRRLLERETLSWIDKQLLKGSAQEVLNRIIKSACRIIGGDTVGSIMLLDERGKYLKPVAIYGARWKEDAPKRFEIGKHGVIGYVAETKQPVLIPDVRDEDWSETYVEVMSGVMSELAVPILDNEENLVGIINLESHHPNAFSKQDEKLIVELIPRALIAIRYLERFEAVERERRKLNILREIDKMILEAQRQDLGQAFDETFWQRILDLVLDEVDAPYGSIMQLDKQQNNLKLIAERGVPDHEKGRRQGLDEGFMGKAATSRQSQLVDDVMAAENADVFLRLDGNAQMRSELTVPILTNDDNDVLIVLNAEKPVIDGFDEEDIDLFENVGRQAVIALEYAERQLELRIERERFKALTETASKIIHAGLDEDRILEIVLETGLNRTGAFHGVVWVLDSKDNKLKAKIVMGEHREELHEPLPLDSNFVNAVAWRTGRPQYLPDVNNPPEGITYRPGHTFTRSMLVLPLTVDGVRIANLDFRHREPAGFGSSLDSWTTR
jgi:putative methionine-R-sulfoxide reductase with GAF domain